MEINDLIIIVVGILLGVFLIIGYLFFSILNTIEQNMHKQTTYMMNIQDQHLQDISGVLSNIERNTDSLRKMTATYFNI